jgi:hypothetical protein
MTLAVPVSAQNVPDESTPQGREWLDINTIATLSIGLVIQSFGYIGIYGDLLSQGVYTSEKVSEMLNETVKYLGNANTIINMYQNRNIQMNPGDKRYLATISQIIDLLIKEAKSLSAFSQSHAEDDLKEYNLSREKAWDLISKLTEQR